MHKNKNKEIRIFGAVIVFIMIAFILSAVIFRSNKDIPSRQSVQVYFLNTLSNKLEPEEHSIARASNEEMINALIDIIYKGPIAGNLSKILPNEVEILEGGLVNSEGLLKLTFSQEYNNMAVDEELFLRSAIVWTMTELSQVKSVQFFVDGQELMRADNKPMGSLSRENVVINALISPGMSDVQRFVLYFSDEDAQGLLRETRTAEVIKLNPDQTTEKYVLEQLIAGPKQTGHYPTIPSETKIREVKTETDICYVNLSTEFITKHSGGSAHQRLTIYSIVNSLTELPGVKKVQFLIESEKPEDFKGGYDLSKPIERDEGIILK